MLVFHLLACGSVTMSTGLWVCPDAPGDGAKILAIFKNLGPISTGIPQPSRTGTSLDFHCSEQGGGAPGSSLTGDLRQQSSVVMSSVSGSKSQKWAVECITSTRSFPVLGGHFPMEQGKGLLLLFPQW